MDDSKLPLVVGGGTALLVALAGIYALSDDPKPADAGQELRAEVAVEDVTVAEAAETEAVDDAPVEGAAVAEATEADATEEETVLEVAEADAAQSDAASANFDLGALNPEQQAAFGAQVRAYILENPGLIMEAVAVLEQREADQRVSLDKQLVDQNRDQLLDDGFSFVGGNPDGDITIVEFLDYRCGFCRRAHPEVEELIASDGNIRLIVKELPILGDASLVSSRFAIATLIAEGPEAYKAVHDALIAFEGEPSAPALGRLAETLELDIDAIMAEMGSEEVNRRIAETRKLAQAMEISGTPTFVFGDEMVRGYAPLDAMREIVAEQRM